MNAAGAEGFRIVPHTAMVKKGITVFNISQVVMTYGRVLLERKKSGS